MLIKALTALATAAIVPAGGHPGVVKQLVAAGADKDALDRQGRTAQDWARANGHVEVSRVLSGRL